MVFILPPKEVKNVQKKIGLLIPLNFSSNGQGNWSNMTKTNIVLSKALSEQVTL